MILLLTLPGSVSAVQLSGIYTSACEREVGIILGVDDTEVKLLDLEGQIKRVKRFDIIYIAHYPMGKINIPKLEPSEGIAVTRIKTVYNNEVVDLVAGWMTNYSEKKISFLTTDGSETVIDIDNVWDVSFEPQDETIYFKGNGSAKRFYFAHPYPFATCEAKEAQAGLLKIYPQHLLETPLLIKTELDRLQKGYKALKTYVKQKVFYPRPQLYTGGTSLSIWASQGLRHGSSQGRESNFIPVVRSELSEGLYQYQQVIVTGAAPMPSSIHEEPQTQFYYGMKSSYFHMSFMYDLIQLISSDYKWQPGDLRGLEDRQNETLNLSGGFDYGNFAIEYGFGSVNYGVRSGTLFHSDTMEFSRFGLFYSDRFVKSALYFGTGNESEGEDDQECIPEDNAKQYEIDWCNAYNEELALRPDINLRYSFSRFNLDLVNFEKLTPRYSLIYKRFEFEKKVNVAGSSGFVYKSEAVTNALYLTYDLDEEDLFISGFASVESEKKQGGITALGSERYETYVKGGMSIGLVF